jgi:hypothetical protein
VAGFTTGDGSFYLVIRANKLNEIPRIDIGFTIAQQYPSFARVREICFY